MKNHFGSLADNNAHSMPQGLLGNKIIYGSQLEYIVYLWSAVLQVYTLVWKPLYLIVLRTAK